MKKYIYGFGTVAVALAMSAAPLSALAENNGVEGQGDANVQVTSVSANVVAGTGENGQSSLEQKGQSETASSGTQARPQIKGGEENGIDLELEDDSEQATSLDDLNTKIEVRKQQLAQEVASSSPADQNIIENANPVRLAVHTLLASRDLLGGDRGIGQQVSEIAKNMNESVASTTNAEAKIQARGFLMRLFFGGDSASAEVIAQEAAQNQQRIDDLTNLLGQANVSADIQVTLKAQIAALQEAQARLQDLAQKEKSAWGLFSWRF